MANVNTNDDTVKYSRVLSSLFCSMSIFCYSILSLLNSLSLDLYSMLALLKVVAPASFCFWFLGYVIGTILDNYSTKITNNKIIDEKKAYEIPSIFGGTPEDTADDEFGGLV